VRAAGDAAPAADGSTDGDPGSTADASPDDAGAADSGGSPSICPSFEAHLAQCAYSSQCQSDFASQCPSAFGLHASASVTAAFGVCSASVSCKDGDPADNACLFSKIVAVPPTAVQAKLARDFCAACAQGAGTTTDNGISCAGYEVILTQGYGRSMGVEVLALSDVAAQTAEACIAPAMSAFPDDYFNCENEFLNCLATQDLVPASCN
jgi:hypothetical protein